MGSERLLIHGSPSMESPRLLLGFSGWMNGGEVATGVTGYFVEKLDADLLAEINSEDFYIFNIPGTMELVSRFRPMVSIRDGIVQNIEIPENTFYYSEENNLIILVGNEPHMKWPEFSKCIFEIVKKFDVSIIYSINAVGGPVPHTRQPRLHATISNKNMEPGFQQLGVSITNYTGPSGISSYLIRDAAENGVPMANVIAEIPPYVHGRNDMCIEFIVKVFCGLLLIYFEHDDLKRMGEQLEDKLNKALEDYPELLERIRELEDNYDRAVFDMNMDEMKHWLEDRGIRLD